LSKTGNTLCPSIAECRFSIKQCESNKFLLYTRKWMTLTNAEKRNMNKTFNR
jgi:hypothetical protein